MSSVRSVQCESFQFQGNANVMAKYNFVHEKLIAFNSFKVDLMGRTFLRSDVAHRVVTASGNLGWVAH